MYPLIFQFREIFSCLFNELLMALALFCINENIILNCKLDHFGIFVLTIFNCTMNSDRAIPSTFTN